MSSLSDVYDKLATDEKERRADPAAQSFLLSGVGDRVINALSGNFLYLCGVGGNSALVHLSLKFGGADIIAKPSPLDFKAPSESEISERTGYQANLVGKLRAFSSTRQYARRRQSIDTPNLRIHRFCMS